MDARRWIFDRFELVPSRAELRRDGVELPLASKPLAVLAELIQQRDRIVTKRELLGLVWPEVSVSDAAFASVIRDLRRALGDSGTSPRFVATIRDQGFRFVCDVLELAEGERGDDAVGGVALDDDSWGAAATHFEAALRALDRVHASRGQVPRSASPLVIRERGELLVALARARWAAGSPVLARAAFLDAAGAARRFGDAETLARAALGFAGRTDASSGVHREAVDLLEEALEKLGGGNLALREAGDASILAYALTARHFVSQRPGVNPRERIRIADRVIALTATQPTSDVVALARQERLLDLLEQADGDGFEREYRQYTELVGELGQPFFRWIHALFQGTRALLAGRVEEAEGHAHAALEIGQKIGTPNAVSAFAAQLFAIRYEQERLVELHSLLSQQSSEEPTLPIFRAGIVAVAAAVGTQEAAEAALGEAMANDLADFPRDDHHSLGVLALLSPAAVLAGNPIWARRLVDALEPFSDRLIVVGHGAAVLGAASHHRGRLNASLGDAPEALRDLDTAVQLYEALGAPRWLARARLERGRLLGGGTP